jgi:hypothetical protein
MSYQSGILLLEECILHMTDAQEESKETSRRRSKKKADIVTISGAENPEVTDSSIWICLAKIYEKLGDVNTVKGLWRRIASDNVRDAFDLQSSGNVKSALAKFEEAIPQEEDSDVKEEITKQALTCKEWLGNWDQLATHESIDVNQKIKTLLRLDRFDELSEMMGNINTDDLQIKYAYPMALMSIS